MEQTSQVSPDLPVSVRKGLERFCSQLNQALGDELASVILYGGLAKGEYFPRSSDVNVMVVLQQVSVEVLDQAAAAVRQASREFRLAVLLLTEDDLCRSTDVFPIKFLEMQRHHRVLWGRDVLSGIQISRDHLRLRCEQEIKNLMLRLRHFYLHRAHLPEAIESTLNGAISSLLGSLAVLLELKTGEEVSDRTDVLAGIERLGVDSGLLCNVLALKRGELKPDAAELKRIYEGFMRTVRQAADLADRL